MEGKGEFKAGDHCQFCKVKATCRKRAEYNLELAKYDFEMPDELEDYEIDAILMKVDQLTAWASDVCQRRCGFVVFRRTENVEKWRVKVYSL